MAYRAQGVNVPWLRAHSPRERSESSGSRRRFPENINTISYHNPRNIAWRWRVEHYDPNIHILAVVIRKEGFAVCILSGWFRRVRRETFSLPAWLAVVVLSSSGLKSWMIGGADFPIISQNLVLVYILLVLIYIMYRRLSWWSISVLFTQI